MDNITINIPIQNYVDAPDGSMLIRKDGKWELLLFEEINKENVSRIESLEKIPAQLENMANNILHFSIYAKSHFIVVFNSFKIKILGGDITVADEELLHLDQLVLEDKISVEEAIKKHEYLEATFNALYIEDSKGKLSEV